jgi:hypothetical protein
MNKIQKRDNGGKRFGKDRRQFSYDDHFREDRRSDRRNSLDRRQDQRYGLDSFQKIQAVSIMTLLFS